MKIDVLRRTAGQVRDIRPDWTEAGILNGIQKLALKYPGASDDEVAGAAIRAASVSSYRAPSMIETQIIGKARDSEHDGEPRDHTECIHGALTRRCALCRRDDPDQPGFTDLNNRLDEQGRLSGRIGRPAYRRPKEIG